MYISVCKKKGGGKGFRADKPTNLSAVRGGRPIADTNSKARYGSSKRAATGLPLSRNVVG